MDTVHRPLVAIVGGPDVDARLPLMGLLAREFTVCALGSAADLAPRFAAAGFAYHSYPLCRRLAPFADVRTVRSLTAMLRRIAPDVVHAFDTKPGVYGCIAARRAGVPVVVTTVTGLGSLYSQHDLRTRAVRGIYATLQRVASRQADRTVFQNHDDLRQLTAAGVVAADRAVVVLGSGVDSDRFDPAAVSTATRRRVRAELGLGLDDTVVTMIARVTRTKGIPEFVAAARTVTARCPGTRFLVVGPDDRDSRDRLGPGELAELRAAVHWPGARKDVPEVLAASDLFVLPTAYREGIPRVLLEAAAMGLPLVATDSPGCNEVVRPGLNGLLVPIGDTAALAAAIAELAGDPQRRAHHGAASRRLAVDEFDLRVVAEQTMSIYRQLLTRGAAISRRSTPRVPC